MVVKTRGQVSAPYNLVSGPSGGYDSDPHHQNSSELHQELFQKSARSQEAWIRQDEINNRTSLTLRHLEHVNHNLKQTTQKLNSKMDNIQEMMENVLSEIKELKKDRILEVTISNMDYPINKEVLHEVFDSYGYIERIDTSFIPNGLQAIIQFESYQCAVRARNCLHGRNIYDNCCQLDVKFNRYADNDQIGNSLIQEARLDQDFVKEQYNGRFATLDRIQDRLKDLQTSSAKSVLEGGNTSIIEEIEDVDVPPLVSSQSRPSASANVIHIPPLSPRDNQYFIKKQSAKIVFENSTEVASACDSNLGLVSSDVQKSMIENIEAMEMDDVLGTEAAKLVQNEDKKIIEKNILCEQNHEMQIVLFAATDSHNLLSQSSSAISGINKITTKSSDSIFKDLVVSCLLPKTTNTTHIEWDEFQKTHDDTKFLDEKVVLLKIVERFVCLSKHHIENILFVFDPGGGSV